MNKKYIAIIIFLVLLIVGVVFIKMKTEKIEEIEKNNVINTNTISINEEELGVDIYHSDISKIENQFKENGINLENKKYISSKEIGENGFEYDINNSKIQMYSVSDEKLKYLTNSENIQQGIIQISTKNSRNIEAINFNNVIILNCMDDNLKQRIIKILNQN